jgi:hypothetical protein
MLNKFHAFIFTLSAVFILSCDQSSEVKGDNPNVNEVTKDEDTDTKDESYLDKPIKFAIKKEPDGTIIKLHRLDKDEHQIKPDGYEWQTAFWESPSKYLSEPEGFIRAATGGVTPISAANGDPASDLLLYIEYNVASEVEKASMDDLDISRVEAFVDLMQWVKSNRLLMSPEYKECQSRYPDPGTERYRCMAPLSVASRMDGSQLEEEVLYKGEVNGHQVFISSSTKTYDACVAEGDSLGAAPSPDAAGSRGQDVGVLCGTHLKEKGIDYDYTGSLTVFIDIDVLQMLNSTTFYDPEFDNNISYNNYQKTKITGATYETPNDFFKKLSDLGIIKEMWSTTGLEYEGAYGYMLGMFDQNTSPRLFRRDG